MSNSLRSKRRSLGYFASSLRHFLLLASVLPVSPLSATVLAVVKTKDGFWIGADSSRGTGGAKKDQVCKIHETDFAVIGKAGSTQGFTSSGVDYSTDEEVFDIAMAGNGASSFERAIQDRYEHDIWEQMAYLLHEPTWTEETISEGYFENPMPPAVTNIEIRNIVLIAVEGGTLKMRQLMVSPSSKLIAQSRFQYFVNVLAWPEITPQVLRKEDVSHPSLHQFGLAVQISEDDAWIQTHPVETLQKVLAEGHRLYPDDAGPPYSIAHVELAPPSKKTKSGLVVTWISRGQCPSWNFKTYNLDFQKENHP